MRANPRNKLHCADQSGWSIALQCDRKRRRSFPLPYSEPHHAGKPRHSREPLSLPPSAPVVFFADSAPTSTSSAVTEPVRYSAQDGI